MRAFHRSSKLHPYLTPGALFWRGLGVFFLLGILFVLAMNRIEPRNLFVASSSVVPAEGVALPIQWGDLGKRMVDEGVFDFDALEKLYATRGGLGDFERSVLDGTFEGDFLITSQNAPFLLNLFWAFGLSNENVILKEGPMMDERYGGAGGFASTGGWTLARGNAMDHYSAHSFASLSDEQQRLVEEVSKNIYRPCCDNSTYFPDCNHGMAMLGLLELLASQGAGEREMYRVALAVNAYWFPSTYQTIAKYLAEQGTPWEKADPKMLLGQTFSSVSGYRAILSQTQPVQAKSGGGCST